MRSESEHVEKLIKHISKERFETYIGPVQRPHDYRTVASALQDYIEDRNLASTVFADISLVEVALRNAMHAALTRDYGERWFEEIPLDKRSISQIERNWERAKKTYLPA